MFLWGSGYAGMASDFLLKQIIDVLINQNDGMKSIVSVIEPKP